MMETHPISKEKNAADLIDACKTCFTARSILMVETRPISKEKKVQQDSLMPLKYVFQQQTF